MRAAGAALLALALWPLGARCQQAPGQAFVPTGADRAAIGDQAGRHLSGAAAINQVAGSGNTQANIGAIALGLHGGTGVADVAALQHPADAPALLDAAAGARAARARIDGAAFASSRGLLAINQAAGTANAQLNVIAIGNAVGGGAALQVTGLDDRTLAGVAGSTPTEGAASPALPREAVIADGAFSGSRGVLQVNQTAGVGNLSTNAIVLQLGGTPQ